MSTTTKNVGRVSIVPKGDWNINNTYIRLDLVTHDGNSYIAKKDVPKNIQLSNNEYWMLIALKGERGTSAYEQAVAGGYTGTEAQFVEDLASFKTLSEQTVDNAEQVALIVDAVEQTMTATTIDSVPIATFEASVAGMPLKGLTVNIEPVQAGEGDPSPENVRPITGWTGCKLHHTGVSLIGGDAFIGNMFSKTANGYQLSYNGSGIANRASAFADIRGLPAGRYTIAMLNPSYPAGVEVNIRRSTAGSTVTMGVIINADSAAGRRIYDIPENTTSLQLYIIPGTTSLNTSITMSDIVIVREGVESEPYKGNTYNITFPTEAGTVYGGTLDVVNRKLNSYPYYSSYNGETIIGPWISSMDVYTPGATPTLGAQVVDMGGAATSYDLSDVHEITTLFGENNIWASCGSVTVTYGAYLETIKVYTDQAADSAAAAEAVLASIPDDYTELNDKIDNLNTTFVAEYDVTTFNEIDSQVQAGNFVAVKIMGLGGDFYATLNGSSFGERGFGTYTTYHFDVPPSLIAEKLYFKEYEISSDEGWATKYTNIDTLNAGLVSQFTYTKAYNIGDYVVHNGTIYKFITTHAANNYWNINEVIQTVLADDVSDLKSDFNMFETRNILQTQLVRDEYIKGSEDGAGMPAQNSGFARTKTLISGYGEKISIELTNPTYEYYVSYYGENGALDGTNYIGYSDYNSGLFVLPEQAKLIGITFRRVDHAALSTDALTEISNSLYFYGVTDTSLSLNGKAADAKSTGIAIENSGIYWSDDTNSLIRTYDALIAKYDELCINYPQYITKNTLTSDDFTNYEYVLTIGNYNSQNGHRGQDAEITKPTILISSGVHGYERSSVMGLYGFVKAMCENVASLNKVIYAATYRIIPIVCPSGYTNDSRINNNGVNINRNFATTDWTLLSTGNDYSGSEPANQPETKIMQTWLENHNDALIYIDWHNSGYLNEISCLLGINTTKTAKWKNKYLTSLNKVIPWWMKGRNIPPSNIYAYTGAPTVEYSNTGTAVTYAREHNIETAFVLETSWNVIDTGKHSKFSIGVGQEAFANMMVGFADLIDNSNAAILG